METDLNDVRIKEESVRVFEAGLEERNAHSSSFIAPIRELDLMQTEQGICLRHEDSNFQFKSRLGMTQLLKKFGIPASYYGKCDVDLKKVNVEAMRDKPGKVRINLLENGVESVVSDRASVIPLVDTFRSIKDTLKGWSPKEIFSQGGRVTVFMSSTRDVDLNELINVESDKPDMASSGLEFSFCDNGTVQFSGDYDIFRVVCTNHMVRKVGGKPFVRMPYLGLNLDKITNTVGLVQSLYNDLNEQHMTEFAATKLESIDESDLSLEICRVMNSLRPKAETVSEIKRYYNLEGGKTRFDLINAATARARDIVDMTSRNRELNIVDQYVLDSLNRRN